MTKNYSQIPQMSEILSKVYDKGYDQGVRNQEIAESKAFDNYVSEQCEKAMQEAWECAKKLSSPDQSLALNVFGDEAYYGTFYNLAEKYSASEAIEKIKAWEEAQQNEIKDDEIIVGDEVICYGADSKSIVIYIEHGEDGYTYYKCFNKLLGICTENDRHKPVKTGKHFERIDEIYKELVGE